MSGAIRFLLDTSIFIACCALALCLGAERLMLGYRPDFVSALHCFIFGSTLLEYNVHYIFNPTDDNRLRFLGAGKKHVYAGIVGLALVVFSMPFLSVRFLIVAFGFGLLSLAYSTPLLPFRKKQRLKDFGLAKILILTGVWVAVGTILPAVYWKIPMRNYWTEILLRTVLIFPLCLAFDIRDIGKDRSNGIQTLPNTLGISTSLLIAKYSLAAFFIGSSWRSIFSGRPAEMLAWGGIAGFAYLFISLSKRNKHHFIYLLLIDGVMLLYGLTQYLI